MRNRIMQQYPALPETFRIENFVSLAFAENLLEMVELSPLTWIYLIPPLALCNSIDLSHEVVNASSGNAADTAGFFFSTPSAIFPSVFTVVLSLIWGLVNCWKTTQIKYMLLPRIAATTRTTAVANVNDDATTTSAYEILPPPVENPQLVQSFVSSMSSSTLGALVNTVESVLAKPPQTSFDALFGTAGAAGVELYRNSIQKQAWLCIAHIVFFLGQIVSRDIEAIWSGAAVGDAEHLIPELLTYGSFVAVNLAQLMLVTPRAFWNFCLVTCLQDEAKSAETVEMLEKSLTCNDEEDD